MNARMQFQVDWSNWASEALQQASGQIEARAHMYPKMQQKVQAMLEFIDAAETRQERETSR